MNKYCVVAIVLFLINACNNSNEETTSSPAPPVEIEKKADSFFPVSSFLRGQMFILDSLPITPLHITIIKGKSDSTWVSKANLRPLFQPFLASQIDETNLVKYFKETRFNDRSLNAVTFTYDPIGNLLDTLSLRHWDVYINPEKGNVTKVYIVREFDKDGKKFTVQLTWQTDKQAKISTIQNKPDGTQELLKEDIVTWDF
ncbi:MAG: hypothetical protein ABJB11_24510 [Ferruginibacter sp.]